MGRLLLFLGFMAFGSGMVYLLAVRDSPPQVSLSAEIPSDVLAMTGVTMRQHEDGGIRYELLAQQAVFDQRTEETNLTDVELRVFEINGKRPAPLALRATAGRARVNKKGGLITLMGDVRLLAGNGAEIRSERIDYEQKQGRIIVPGAVWVKVRDAIHQADSLIYDVHRERMTFTAPIFYQ